MTKLYEPNELYHKNLAIGSTTIKKAWEKSVMHAFSQEVRVENRGMRVGSALHTAILEPHLFANQYVIAPDWGNRSVADKARWVAFKAKHAGKSFLTKSELEDVMNMKQVINSHKNAFMFQDGEAEFSYYGTCDVTGLAIKARPDYIKNGRIIDIKTTQDASRMAFTKEIADRGYHLQAAHYIDVYNQVTGSSLDEFYFVAIESIAPYAVAFYRLTKEDLNAGRSECKRVLRQIKNFFDRGGNINEKSTIAGFGYESDIIDLKLPHYLLTRN